MYSLLLKVFTGQEKSIEMPKAKAFRICPIRITANISAFQAEDVGSIPTWGFKDKVELACNVFYMKR